MIENKLIQARRWWFLGLSIIYMTAMHGMAKIHSFHFQVCNRSLTISFMLPMFELCGDVTRNLRKVAESNPEIARIAGLDFPAHGVE